MAYVDRTFSISDDDTGTFIVHNRPPIKEIGLAISLLVIGAVGIIAGLVMIVNKTGGDRGHGMLFPFLILPFLPFCHVVHRSLGNPTVYSPPA